MILTVTPDQWLRPISTTLRLRGADTCVCGVETRLDALGLRLVYVPASEHKHRDESRCGSLKAAPRSATNYRLTL